MNMKNLPVGKITEVGTWAIHRDKDGAVFAFHHTPRGAWTAKHKDIQKVESLKSLPKKVKEEMIKALIEWYEIKS